MKVLWVVNIVMPEASKALCQPATQVEGWLTGYKNALLDAYPDLELHIVSPSKDHSEIKIGKTTHHLFQPSNKLHKFFSELYNEIKPDVVHIHGTEFPHSLIWVEACGCQHTLISIQGLSSICADHYMGGLTKEDLRGCWSFNDWRFNRTLTDEKENLARRGAAEIELLKRVINVAGRTTWDKENTLLINPTLKYHTLQEILREPFYNNTGQWEIDKCQAHRIFVSQSHYPLKGLHKLLLALPIVRQLYPDVQLCIVGEDRIEQHWRHRSTYVNVLRKLIYQNDLRDCILYQGYLSAEQMVKQFKLANVYICPSSIENSCNSLCEAQLVGTPVVASDVGGLKDLVEHEKTGLLYKFDDIKTLAQQICQIFADGTLAKSISQAGCCIASKRHDKIKIIRDLYNIYSLIKEKSYPDCHCSLIQTYEADINNHRHIQR